MKKILLIICAVIFVVVIIPLILNLIMGIQNEGISILRTETEQTWLNFFGSYLGGITGAALTVLVSYLISKHLDISREKQNIKAKYTIRMFDSISRIRNEIFILTADTFNYFSGVFISKKVDKNAEYVLQEQMKKYTMSLLRFINMHSAFLIDESEKLEMVNSLCCNCFIHIAKSLGFEDTNDIINYFNSNTVAIINELRQNIDNLYYHIVNKYLNGILPNIPHQKATDIPAITTNSLPE